MDQIEILSKFKPVKGFSELFKDHVDSITENVNIILPLFFVSCNAFIDLLIIDISNYLLVKIIKKLVIVRWNEFNNLHTKHYNINKIFPTKHSI